MTDYLKDAERAINYLAESEADYARYKALHQAEKERLKIVKAGLSMDSLEKSQTAKDKDAESHSDYQRAVEDWQQSMEEYYLIEAKRKRAELTVDMYRSVNSALKRGNI